MGNSFCCLFLAFSFSGNLSKLFYKINSLKFVRLSIIGISDRFLTFWDQKWPHIEKLPQVWPALMVSPKKLVPI